MAAGPKWAPWWALPVNASAWPLNRPYITSFEGFAEPWRHLGEQLPDLRVETLPGYAGGAYIARGTAPGANIPTGRWAR